MSPGLENNGYDTGGIEGEAECQKQTFTRLTSLPGNVTVKEKFLLCIVFLPSPSLPSLSLHLSLFLSLSLWSLVVYAVCFSITSTICLSSKLDCHDAWRLCILFVEVAELG